MALIETQVKVSAVGNDIATIFSFSPVKINQEEFLDVYIVEDSTTIVTQLVLGVDYLVIPTEEYPSTGSVRYPINGAALPTGWTITMIRNSPLKQETVLENQGPYNAKVQEQTYDYSRMIDQEIDEQLSRTLVLDPTTPETFDNSFLPQPDTVIGVSADGLSIENYLQADFQGDPGPVGPGGDMSGANNLSEVVASGDPTTAIHNIDGYTQTEIDGLVGGSAQDLGWVGDVRVSFRSSPPAWATSSWIRLDDTEIGNAGSTATHASADYEDLYTLLWDDISQPTSNTFCTVSGGLGASAAADWAALKTLDFPKALGRKLISAGTGAFLSSHVLGENAGSETRSLGITNIPEHLHSVSLSTNTTGNHSHSITTAGDTLAATYVTKQGQNSSGSANTTAAGSHSHTVSGDTGTAGQTVPDAVDITDPYGTSYFFIRYSEQGGIPT